MDRDPPRADPAFDAATTHEPLAVVSIGLHPFATASPTQANMFPAAFAGGATVATSSP